MLDLLKTQGYKDLVALIDQVILEYKVPLHLWSKDASKLQCKKEAMKCWYLIANEIVALKEPEAGCKFFKLNLGL